MQLLDDDMDELFRNAASRYPLKTDGADWDALSRRLHPEDDAVPPPPAGTPVPEPLNVNIPGDTFEIRTVPSALPLIDCTVNVPAPSAAAAGTT